MILGLTLILLAGRANAAESVVYSFFGGAYGAAPAAALIADHSGVLYGTTEIGGNADCSFGGCGTVFSLTPPTIAGGDWTQDALHSFASGNDDGANPLAELLAGNGGVLFGTTSQGGPADAGTVFELTPPATSGGAWTESLLYSFNGGADGAQPDAGLIADSNGVLYGTTRLGGAPGFGTVFALTPPATVGGAWTESVLYSFAGGTDGSMPVAGLLLGKGGTLYGTTEAGGVASCESGVVAGGCGTIFSLNPPTTAGGAWTESVLHAFSGRPDGAAPAAALISQQGALVGTTLEGGQGNLNICNAGPGDHGCGAGTIFSLAPPTISGGAWTEHILYRFIPNSATSSDGQNPSGRLAASPAGVLYGTTQSGGFGSGTILKLIPPATSGGPWIENILHRFQTGEGITDGISPTSGVVFSNHQLYGTTVLGGAAVRASGTVFQQTP